MSASILASAVAVLVALISGVVTFITARRSHKLEVSKVDVAAYERAKEFNDSLVSALRTEVDRLNEQVARLRTELETEERENQVLRKQMVELSQTANRLRLELSVLQQRLRE